MSRRKRHLWVVFDSPSDPDTIDVSRELKTEDWKTERHVLHALQQLGYTTERIALFDSINPLFQKLAERRPDLWSGFMNYWTCVTPEPTQPD